MTVHRISLKDLPPERPPLAPGEYRVRVDTIDTGANKDGAPSFRVRMTVVDGEHVGEQISDTLFDTPKAKVRLVDFITACGVELEEETDVDLNDLIGAEVMVRIELKQMDEPGGRARAMARVAFRGYSRPHEDLPF